jgi:TP901 family phage tail tape measure protein
VVTDLLVRINATAAGYDAAMAKAQLSTYKFDTALRQANLAVGQLEAEMAAAGPAAAASAAKMAEAQTAATLAMTKKVGTAFGVMGAAGAVGFGLLAKAAADFDEKMATLGSLIPHTAKQMDGLRTSAMNAGKDIAVSGTAAADAEIELAKAGISAADIMGGALRGSLLLAAAGQTDVATATEVAASAMVQFGLKGKDVPHIADLLAAAADKSLGSVTDLGYALSQAGTTAHQSGISIEQTTGVLAEFAAAGLTGERGGTAFKTMLLRLESPSKEAADLMTKYGLSLYDASGQIKSMPALAANLVKSFGDLAPAERNAALETIGGTRAIQGFNIMMQAGGPATADWIAKVNDSGFAAQQATDKLDSLNGDLEKFKTAMSDAAIQTGEAAQGPLRDLVQILTELVNGFNGLPAPVKSSVVGLLAATAVVGGLGFVVSRMILGFVAMKASLTEASVAMGGFNKTAIAMRAGAFAAGVGFKMLAGQVDDSNVALQNILNISGDVAMGFAVGGPWGAAIGGAVGVLSAFTHQTDHAVTSTDDLTGSLNKQTFAVSKTSRAMVAKGLVDAGLIPDIQKLGLSTSEVVSAMLDEGNAAPRLQRYLESLTKTTDLSGTIAHSGGVAILGMSDSEKQMRESALKLLPVLSDQNKQTAEARQRAQDLRDAQIDLKGKTEGSTAAVENSTAMLKKHAAQMAANSDQAKQLADRLSNVPGSANAAERALGSMASGMNKDLAGIHDEPVNVNLSTKASHILSSIMHTFAQISPFETGGTVSGGIPGRDSVHGLLMPGERVTTTAVVNKAGSGSNQRGQRVMAAVERMIVRGQLGKFGDIPAFASGGPVVQPRVHSTGEPAAIDAVSSIAGQVAAGMAGVLSKTLNKALTQMTFGSGSPLGLAGSLTPAGIVRGQEFARSQAGKPYEWGAVGPNSYDCSGFQSAVLNAAHNARNPYRRVGSTSSMPWDGSAPGVGMYTIGWSTNVGGSGIGHTSGNIGGLGVESNGTDGVVTGSAALSPLSSMFTGLMHYDRGGILKPGLTLAHNGTGRNEVVLAPRASGRGGRGGSRRFVLEGPMTLDVDGHQLSGVVRGIVREEVSDEFRYMSAGV